jgi:hypothetical protein
MRRLKYITAVQGGTHVSLNSPRSRSYWIREDFVFEEIKCD